MPDYDATDGDDFRETLMGPRFESVGQGSASPPPAFVEVAENYSAGARWYVKLALAAILYFYADFSTPIIITLADDDLLWLAPLTSKHLLYVIEISAADMAMFSI